MRMFLFGAGATVWAWVAVILPSAPEPRVSQRVDDSVVRVPA